MKLRQAKGGPLMTAIPALEVHPSRIGFHRRLLEAREPAGERGRS